MRTSSGMNGESAGHEITRRWGRLRPFVARWGPLAAVALAGLIVFVWKVRIVAPIQYVGHGDAAAYAEMADSILKGRGLEVDYITWYFRKYDAQIVRPEDHWPPFYSFLIVPFFAVMGKTALAAKLPSLLISTFAWPLTLYALALRVTRSRVVAFASAITILLYVPAFGWSLCALSDVTYGSLVTLTVLCAVEGYDDSRWFSLMGLSLACAYYAKGSTLVLLGGLVGYHLIWRALNRPRLRWTRRDSRFAVGVGVCFLLMTPWFVRNTIHFGNPIYSTHSHAAGYIGWKNWETTTYALYWGEREPPSIMDKLRQPGMLRKKTAEFLAQNAWWTFGQWGARPTRFDVRNLSTYWTGYPAVLGIGMFFAVGTLGLFVRWKKNPGPRARSLWRWLRPFVRPEYGLFLLVGSIQVAFLSLLWEPIDRLLFPVVPFVVLIGWATWFVCFERVTAGWKGRSYAVASVAVLCLLGVWATHECTLLHGARANAGYPWKEGGEEWMEVGKWIRANAPGSITMTRNPWELHFYSEEKAIQIPLTTLARTIEVADYYGATLLIPDPARPALKPWAAGTIPGLEKVHESRGLPLYAIHYEALPDDLQPPSRRRPGSSPPRD